VRVFENSVMRILFALKRVEVVGGLKDFIMRSFMTCLPHPVLLGDQERRMRWAGHVARMGKIDKCIRYFGWKT